MENRPKTTTKTTIERQVKFTMSVEEHSAALNVYLKRIYAEFRNIDIDYTFKDDGTVECEGYKEIRK